MAPTVEGPESDFTVTASPPAPSAASTPEATRRRSQTGPASNRPLNKDATDARGGEDRGREDRGAGREGVPEVVAEREGRTATNGRGQRTDPPRCSPSPLPADPARPFAHDERSCLRRWAQHPQVSLPPKQCTANVRARRPELLSVRSTPLPMCARGGGGRLGRSAGGRELEHRPVEQGLGSEFHGRKSRRADNGDPVENDLARFWRGNEKSHRRPQINGDTDFILSEIWPFRAGGRKPQALNLGKARTSAQNVVGAGFGRRRERFVSCCNIWTSGWGRREERAGALEDNESSPSVQTSGADPRSIFENLLLTCILRKCLSRLAGKCADRLLAPSGAPPVFKQTKVLHFA